MWLCATFGKRRLDQVRPGSYDFIRDAASDRVFNEIVFLAFYLTATDWNEDIVCDLDWKMTTSDF